MRYGWSLNREDWNRLLRYVADTCWQLVDLLDVNRDSVPKRPGVYIICASAPNCGPAFFARLYEVIYAGQTESLQRRFLEHCNEPKPEIRSARDCFQDPLQYWFTPANPEELDKLESALIECFGPPANKVGKPYIKARVMPAEPA